MAQVSLKNVSGISTEGGAVRDCTLEVRDREFAVLVGPPGCGNSTLLRLIAGLDPVSGGEITIGNRPVNTLSPLAREVAMVFPHYALFPNLPVSANIAFGLKGRHFPKTEMQKRVREAAGVAGITEALARKPQTLTAVEKLKVALARAIVGQPKAILMDEPLAALEPAERAGMRAELVKLQERLQTTLIYATRDPLEAMALGQRVAVLREGALQQFDTPLALYERPANLFVARSLGQPPMNLLAGRLRTAPEGLLFKETGGTVEVQLAALPPGKEGVGTDVVLGIRPEEIRIVPDAETKTRGVRCQGIIDHVETTGAEVFYSVQTGAHVLVIRSGAGEHGGAGRRMQFDIDPQKVHLFDAATTGRI
ncbi:MAG: ABC transporter ATP-binding protein [Verrucomicrobia bacterium]|nr:ABC transporter ATP-binding protein [Verrucomicrobiota bacterium]